MPTAVSRRRLVAATAWSVPVVLVGQPASAASCSAGASATTLVPNLRVSASVSRRQSDGHYVGPFTFRVRNDGLATIPAGTTYTVVFSVTKSPANSTGRSLTVTGTTVSGMSLSSAAPVTMNPDGAPNGVTTFAVTLSLTTNLTTSQSRTMTWNVDSTVHPDTTRLTMVATLAGYGGVACYRTSSFGESSETGRWEDD